MEGLGRLTDHPLHLERAGHYALEYGKPRELNMSVKYLKCSWHIFFNAYLNASYLNKNSKKIKMKIIM